MVVSWWFDVFLILMGFHGIYPLVNVYITMENHQVQWVNQPLARPCSIARYTFTRGYDER